MIVSEHDHRQLTGPAAAATRETLEDYTSRFAPRGYRKWGAGVVAIWALGGIAYLADFAIGANIGIANGSENAPWGILFFAVVIILTGSPLAFYAARYNIDLDLITRGSGFGYYGSGPTNVIFASFTFIFFALEGSIMAQGLRVGRARRRYSRPGSLSVRYRSTRRSGITQMNATAAKTRSPTQAAATVAMRIPRR